MMDKLKQAPARWSRAAPSLPNWLNAYGDFVTKNAGSVSQIESALRSLTYIIPVHGGVQLLSLYHDSLLARAISRLPAGLKKSDNHATPHNRYTRFWTQTSPVYRRIALTLQMIQYTELLCEMAARRRSERARWRVVLLLEVVKACCRLFLLRLTNSRPLLTPPLPEREGIEVDASREATDQEHGRAPLTLAEDEQRPNLVHPSAPSTTHGASTVADNERERETWPMPRTGLTLPSLPTSTDITTYLLSNVLTAEDIKPPPALLHQISGQGQIAEYLYILRPVIYVLAIQYWRTNHQSVNGRQGNWKRSWQPWLLGLGIEYGARQLAKGDFQARVAGGLRGLTRLEREEMRRRAVGMAWWGLRGAFWENVTKYVLQAPMPLPSASEHSTRQRQATEERDSSLIKSNGAPRSWMQGLTLKLRNKPILDLIGNVLEDYEFLWDEYYFSTATL